MLRNLLLTQLPVGTEYGITDGGYLHVINVYDRCRSVNHISLDFKL